MRKILWTSVLVVLVPLALVLAQPSGPAVTLQLGTREGHAVPTRSGFAHTGGGNMDVAQPTPDSLVITMTGVAVAGGHPVKDSLAMLQFDLVQCFEVSFEKPEITKAKLTLEGRIIGLLRSHCKGGFASQGPAHAGITCGPTELVGLTLPSHAVAGGENLSVNDRQGPTGAIVVAGTYHLHQSFTVSASHPHSLKLSKAASAEFAPDPALDPLWISYWEPFHGANKKDFGFQVIVRVTPENGAVVEKKAP